LRQCAPAIAELGGRMPWTEAQAFLDHDYPDGRRYYWKSTLVRALDDGIFRTTARRSAIA
jgi:hypothetical protein